MVGLVVAGAVLALFQANVADAPLGVPIEPQGNPQSKPVIITNPDWIRRPTAKIWRGARRRTVLAPRENRQEPG